jgi:cytochrome c5
MWRVHAAALLLFASVCVANVHAGPAPKQEPQARPPTSPVAASPGQQILGQKCFQCHAASMWTPLRQDRKAWESVLYRMVGRGALWTEAEVNAMADFLAQTRGPAK